MMRASYRDSSRSSRRGRACVLIDHGPGSEREGTCASERESENTKETQREKISIDIYYHLVPFGMYVGWYLWMQCPV